MTDTLPPGGDFQCVVHMSDWDPDCDVCKTEVTAIEHQVRNNADANRLIEQRLAQLGSPVGIVNVLSIRLNTLIESACGGNPKTRAKFELSFMANYAHALQQAEQNSVRANLMHGVRQRG